MSQSTLKDFVRFAKLAALGARQDADVTTPAGVLAVVGRSLAVYEGLAKHVNACGSIELRNAGGDLDGEYNIDG